MSAFLFQDWPTALRFANRRAANWVDESPVIRGVRDGEGWLWEVTI